VGGIPNIARELGFVNLANFLIQPTSRVVEIAIALLITCYFAFSFIYSSKKNWQRQTVLEQIKTELLDLETQLLECSHRLTILYKVKSFTQKIISMFNVLKHTKQSG
jgi:TRAP-type C4-dicarboxylate transport system permease small subunit